MSAAHDVRVESDGDGGFVAWCRSCHCRVIARTQTIDAALAARRQHEHNDT